MKYILFTALTVCLMRSTSFYSHSVSSVDNTSIDFNNFQGKKVLLVNIATGSSRVSQLAELQTLQQQYSDSLIVIGFPSNSFGNESRSNADIKTFCQNNYGVTFTLASKGDVKGPDQQGVYYWLTHTSENNALDSDIKSDMQKYLVDKDGELIGVFVGSVSPLSPQIINNITAAATSSQNQQ